ncbi:MAG: hypothetical protein CL910_07995 [Deltaproteobacteria bacterium]|nr:hypothetical protein [Deltaproteobacteria bacterium]
MKQLFALLRWLLLPLLAALLAFVAGVQLLSDGVTGRRHERGRPAGDRIPAAVVSEHAATQVSAAAALGAATDRQILFGDLHVHTTYSSDAFVFSLPLFQGEGVHPPADACDFARFCAELDFWSINDHAEFLTPWQWSETKEAIRECNAVAGDPANPDLVSFLGWEWTQSAPAGVAAQRPHFGHKNVVFLDTEEDRVPSRPIGAGRGGLFATPLPSPVWALLRAGMVIGDLAAPRPYLDFHRYTRDARALSACPEGVAVRDLQLDCLEGAETPGELFDKLDDWGFRSLVIPHGTSWGIHAPPAARLSQQLEPGQHDPERQRLFEVYSGHGNSELYRELAETVLDEKGQKQCAAPRNGYLPCCWQAGEIIRSRCGDAEPAVCEERVARTRELVAGGASHYSVVSGTRPNDWLECGQLTGEFLSAFEYRPHMSAQFGLASRRPAQGEAGAFRYGLIGSSDNHKARPGPGYKEVERKAFGDAYGLRRDWYDRLTPPSEPLPEPVEPGFAGLGVGFERGASFYYTGGLVAVHAAGRDRDAIFDSLEQRHAYATSGPRILLWFDLENGPEGEAPMGSEVRTRERPRFRVRALGSFEQKPGCPEHTERRLSPDRLRRLCLGECYHPSDRRIPIDRVEVVRIRPQVSGDEPIGERIDDPWRSFSCEDSGAGCEVHFDDPDFTGEHEFLYYVRALQVPTVAVNGDPMRCERDEQGRCLRARACPASGPDHDPNDDCLSRVNERAWSSPIWLRPPSH